jgi:hypothetical protein
MAAQKTIHENWLGFYKETTPCVAPASWANDATWIEHLSVDTSGIKETLIADPVLSRRAFNLGTRKAIKGLRNCSFSASLPLHGTGVTTADGVQVAQTYLGDILEHCMGGVHRGTAHEVAGGDSVDVELDSVTGIIPGCVIAFEDTTSPSEVNEGRLHPRRVIEVDAVGKIVTLSEALPFTPAAGDIAHPAITPYLDSDVLVDAFATPTTYQWFIRKARTGTDLLWTVEGSVASMKIDGLGRGALPSISLDVMGANFRHDDLTNPNPTVFQGHPQLSMGLDVICSIGEYLDDTLVTHHANNVSFEPGFSRSRVETVTEKVARAGGTATYTFSPAGDTKFSVTLTPYDISWYQGLQEGKEYRVSLYQPGDGTGAGKGWMLHLARCQLIETPSRADLNENHAVTLVFKAMEAEDCVGGSNEDLERTRFTLALF